MVTSTLHQPICLDNGYHCKFPFGVHTNTHTNKEIVHLAKIEAILF